MKDIYFYGFPILSLVLLTVLIYIYYTKADMLAKIEEKYNEIQLQFAENADIIFQQTIKKFNDLTKELENKIVDEIKDSNCISELKNMHQEISAFDIEAKNLQHHVEKFVSMNKNLTNAVEEKDRIIRQKNAIIDKKNKQIKRLKEQLDEKN